jgi:uncharacterized protein YabN with tetrapyrrole methylase and pyrophosphatase domain
LDAEDALRAACLKFELRFEAMEREAQQRALVLQELSATQWEQLWIAAKLLNRKP